MITGVICLLLISSTFASLPSEDLVQKEWQTFKIKYNKQYDDPLEEFTRKLIFAKSFRNVMLHNAQAMLGIHSYTLELNEFADMATNEFLKRNGFRMTDRKPSTTVFHPIMELNKLPETVDWREKGLVTPIKNQLQCGSCWAFSAVASLEGQWKKFNGTLVSLSEQNLVDCSGPQGNHGCNGGLMDQAFDYIIANNGIDTEDSYPYEGVDNNCRFNPNTVGATMTKYVDIPTGDEDALQEAAATIGPISVAIDASSEKFRLYSGGVYDDNSCSSTRLDHGVTVVGYGTENGKDYWLVKNSWGADWGLDGYIKMSRNKNNQCGIATIPSYPIV